MGEKSHFAKFNISRQREDLIRSWMLRKRENQFREIASLTLNVKFISAKFVIIKPFSREILIRKHFCLRTLVPLR